MSLIYGTKSKSNTHVHICFCSQYICLHPLIPANYKAEIIVQPSTKEILVFKNRLIKSEVRIVNIMVCTNIYRVQYFSDLDWPSQNDRTQIRKNRLNLVEIVPI